MQPTLQWNYLFAMCFVGAALNFLPNLLGYTLRDPETNQYPDYVHALTTFQYFASIVVSLAATIPIFLDLVVDLLTTKLFSEAIQLEDSVTNIPFREIVLLLIIPDILLVFWILPYARFDLVAPLITSRDTMYTFCFLSYMVQFNNKYWTHWTTVMINGPLMVANIMVSFSVVTTADPKSQYIFNFALIILISIGLSSLTVTLARWYWFVLGSGNYDPSHPNYSPCSKRFKTNFLCTIFATLLAIFLYMDWIIFYLQLPNSSSWSLVGCDYLSTYNYTMAACTVCMTVFVNRFARLEAVDTRNVLEIKQMFMRYISHEMRTPLNVAFLGLKILKDELNQFGNPDLLGTLRDTKDSCMAALDILNGMLLYDSISGGMMTLQRKVLEPVSFVTSVMKPFRTQARSAGIDLRLHLAIQSASPLRLNGDPQKLAQVIRNLLSNALKFTNRGGSILLTISIDEGMGGQTSLEEDTLSDIESGRHHYLRRRSSYIVTDVQRRLILSIQDSGIGIDKERQSTLFEGTVQFSPGTLQKGQGTGLGLYISKHIVDQHGGSLSVYSAGEDMGSTFTVTLPLQASDGSDNEEELHNPFLRDDRSVSEANGSSRHLYHLSPITPASPAESQPNSQSSRSKGPVLTDDSIHLNPPHPLSTSPLITTIEEETAVRSLSVLVVDDSVMNRRMVCRALQTCRQFHFNCDQAEDGRIAVDMVREKILLIANMNSGTITNECSNISGPVKHYDLILMDYQMPNMDGPTAIAEIRKMGFCGVILGLTGNALQCDMDLMVAAGANDVLLKPLNLELLWNAIRNFEP